MFASPDWIRVEPARVKQLASGELRQEQRAWKAAQKHQILHEQRTRIIVDHSLTAHSATLPLTSPCEEKESSTQAYGPLQDHYSQMRQRMHDEVMTLRQLIASRARMEDSDGIEEEDEGAVEAEDRRLPSTASSLLGTFSPHLVSRHLPALHSYPTFHFGQGSTPASLPPPPPPPPPPPIRHIFLSPLPLVRMCSVAFQPHLASCYTLNQAYQLLHRVRLQLSSQPSSLSSMSFAYSISSGIGRLSSTSSALLPDSGERLLDLLRSHQLTNTLLIVMGRPSHHTLPASLAAQQSQQRDRLRLLLQTAKLLLQHHLACTLQVQQELPELAAAPVSSTFLTQPAEVEEERPVVSADLRPLAAPVVAALPVSPALQLHVQHAQRQSHYLHTAATFTSPLTHPSPLSPTRSPPPIPSVHWSLDELRADMMVALSVTSATEASLPSASLLCKHFHMQPAVPQEEGHMVSEEVYRRVKDWLLEHRHSGRLPEQRVNDWATVREAVWSVYLLHMKLLRPSFRQSELERMARTPTPHFTVRMLCSAVAAALGWEDDSWEGVRGYLGGWRAVEVSGGMEEFAPPEVTEWSPAWEKGEGGSPYVHGRVGGVSLWGEGVGGEGVAGEGGVGVYRSDVWAHLVGVRVGGLGEGVVRRVEGVLMERALGWEEVRALEGGEGWVGLLEWLVLLLRCERLWTVAHGLFIADVSSTDDDNRHHAHAYGDELGST